MVEAEKAEERREVVRGMERWLGRTCEMLCSGLVAAVTGGLVGSLASIRRRLPELVMTAVARNRQVRERRCVR